MIKYQVLQGVRLSGASGLPTVTPTPEGKAMASIPGWLIMIDPAYREGPDVLNRAAPSAIIPSSDSPPVGAGSFPTTNEPAFAIGTGHERFFPDVAFPVEAWTFFSVLNGDFLSTQSPKELVLSKNLDQEYALRLGFNASGTDMAVFTGPTPSVYRIRYAPPDPFEGRTALVMYTFSTREGLRLYHNGELGAHEPTETQPLDHSVGPNQWEFFSLSLRGLVGMTGLLDIDLGWPEHAGYRRSIERFLMDKYGIT